MRTDDATLCMRRHAVSPFGGSGLFLGGRGLSVDQLGEARDEYHEVPLLSREFDDGTGIKQLGEATPIHFVSFLDGIARR